MRIVLLDRGTFSAAVHFARDRLTGSEWREYDRTADSDVPGRAAGADVVITNKVRFPSGVFERLPDLRLIAVAATGVDHIDLVAAEQRGIAVANVGAYAVHSVAEHVFGMLLALRRNLPRYTEAARDGRWSGAGVFCLHDWPIHDLAGSVLGIIGVGQNGNSVARLAEAFGMRVLRAERRAVHPPRRGRVPFDQVLAESDAISLHVPLTADTRGLIGAPELRRMKPGAVLVNTARGGVVDEAALLDALRDGRIGGAALDVLSVEPPPADHALLRAHLPNLIVTPHVAWAGLQAQQQLADEVVENIAAFRRGERRNRVI